MSALWGEPDAICRYTSPPFARFMTNGTSGDGSSFDEGQRPSHGSRCGHQYDRGCEYQTQQTEEEHMLAHVGALSTKAKVGAGRSDKASLAQPKPTSWPLGWSTPSRRQIRT